MSNDDYLAHRFAAGLKLIRNEAAITRMAGLDWLASVAAEEPARFASNVQAILSSLVAVEDEPVKSKAQEILDSLPPQHLCELDDRLINRQN